MCSLSPWQGVSVEEKRSGDREVWLKWLSRYSQRLYQELEPGTDVSKVCSIKNTPNYRCLHRCAIGCDMTQLCCTNINQY